MILKKFILASFVAIVPLLSSMAPLYAQEVGTFDTTVSPTFVETTAKPGSTISQTVRLRNNSTTPVTLTAEVKIMGGDEAGALTIKDDKAEHLAWLALKDNKVILRPKEWTTVPFTLTIPESASYGYYWALSFTSNAEQADSTGTTLNASIVVPILLSVEKAGAKTEGKLTEFKTTSGYYEYPPITFTNIFENTGNVHVKPQGNIFIKDFFGRTVATLNVNDSQGSVLPGIKRSFESTWNDGFVTYEPKIVNGDVVMDENGKPKQEMKIHFQKLLDLRIGKYTATSLLLVSGADKDYTYEKSISFFVFPWKIVLIILAIAVFVGIGLFTTSRSIVRKVKGIFRK